jgi:methyltransferase (TIGR00027 family)
VAEPKARVPTAHRLAGRPSVTAEAVTLARAVEHLRPPGERIVDDPYAELFLGAAGRAAVLAWKINGPATRLLKRLDPGGMAYVACRHRYLDDQLLGALDEGVEQVVLLGAGYDTRAYRFANELNGRPVYEVDLAAIGARKARVIAGKRGVFPAADVHRVEIDFENQTLTDTLKATEFRVGAPTFVVWEGVSMYLTRNAVKATVGAVHELCGAGSALGMDMWHLVDDPGPMGTVRRTAPAALSVIGEPVTFGVHPEEMTYFLDQLGFGIRDLATSDVLEARYCGPGRTVDASMYLLTAARN